ncbi:hypothetical protein YC2023_092318 [Brassica napus]
MLLIFFNHLFMETTLIIFENLPFLCDDRLQSRLLQNHHSFLFLYYFFFSNVLNHVLDCLYFRLWYTNELRSISRVRDAKSFAELEIDS